MSDIKRLENTSYYASFIEGFTAQINFVNDLADCLESFGSRVANIYTDIIAPSVTKENVDQYLTSSLSVTAYYTLAGATGLGGASFVAKAGVAIGYKLFATFANPAISQVVESYTDTQIKNVKTVYHFAQCHLFDQNCDTLDNHTLFSPTDIQGTNILTNFSQFDMTKYVTQASAGMENISLKGLLATGVTSALATQIKDITFDVIGLTPHCDNYFCKNWVSYYFREWVKDGIKNEIPFLNNKPSPLAEPVSSLEQLDQVNTTTQISQPLDIKEIILMPSFDNNNGNALDVFTEANFTTLAMSPIHQAPAVPTIEQPVLEISHFA